MKTKIFLIAALAALSSSCEDFLTYYPEDKLTAATFFQTNEDYAAAANGMYALMTGYPSEFYPMIDEMTPFAGSPTTARCGVFHPYNGSRPMVATGLDFTRQTWQNMYKGIQAANNILENAEKPTKADVNIVNRTMGEAYFIRGYAYFTLTTLFGDVPFFTKTQSYDELFKERTSKEKVIEQAILDLKEAERLLPSVKQYRGTADLGRASKGAASAFLGKIYVYQKRWEEARNKFAEIVDAKEPDYDLVKNYYDQFWPDGENGIESIYEIQYSVDRIGGTLGGSQIAFNRFQDFVAPIAEAQMNFSGGFNYMEPNEHYCDLFETTSGYSVKSEYISREEVKPSFYVFKYNFKSGDPLFDKENPYEMRDPRLKYTTWYEGSPTIKEFEKKSGQTGVSYLSRYSKTSNHSTVKYIVGKLGNRRNHSPMNMIVMRYADVLLLYAESCIETNKLSKAVSLINRVRERVGMPTVEKIGQIQNKNIAGDKSNLMEYLREERFRELGFEWGHMAFDMIRWDILVDELKEYWVQGRDGWPTFSEQALNFTKDCYLFPIPLAEMTANPQLEQNPGY